MSNLDAESTVGSNAGSVDPTAKQKRLPRYRRAERQEDFALTGRDLDILQIVEALRCAASDHVVALIDGSDQGKLRRLQKLYHAGYVDRITPRRVYGAGSQKMIYAITNKGFRTLQAAGRVADTATDWNDKNRRIQDLAVQHTLLISRVRTVFTAACKQHPDIKLLHWREGRALIDRVEVSTEGSAREIPVAPDAYFAIEDAKGRMNFFLEADRGTMTLERFTMKLRAYAAYFREKKHEEKFKIRFFRVLTVTTSETRRSNLVTAAEAEEALRRRGKMFLFAEESQLSLRDPESIFRNLWVSLGNRDLRSIVGEAPTTKKGEFKTCDT